MAPDEATARSESEDREDGETPRAPGRLVVASNRQPYRHEYGEDGGIEVDAPTGGLTAGLDPVVSSSGGTWIAWGDGEADREVADDEGRVAVPPGEESYTLQRVWLPEAAVEGYYYGFSNRVLWPICHEFVDLIDHRPEDRDWYRHVNREFADAIVDHADEESVVWLQDYHLGLAPAMVSEAVPPETTVAQFWHIPWPRAGAFRAVPDGRELLEGLLGNDLLGFHVESYVATFLDCVEEFVPGAAVDRETAIVGHGDGETRVVATPMGVDAESYDERSRAVDRSQWERLKERYDLPTEATVAVGVDRLDYTKGIPERLAAIEELLAEYPRWRGEFTFVQKGTPSRTDIPAYRDLGEQVRSEVARINDRFGTDDWRPIVYTEEFFSQEELCALYRYADAMIVSPLLDGMNLVSQEYVAASVDGGALVLSERAGATEVLGEDVYTIDPAATDSFAATIDEALSAPEAERTARMDRLREHVFDHDLEWWMDRQFDEIARCRNDGADRDGGRPGPGSETDSAAEPGPFSDSPLSDPE
ncbi:alpha,alpha-trehalose-phosphate synthase (UDP-forming) [Saliphagus infecundisoli]|uniref:Trehalose-6-phosphate synthase n=1 Tax=Saliphagus infecundisoli TaxID=1849069 RepID=A0ABD5QCL6_9EURY|nr:trehalose-6-phosphate synthase [Saliphagus infecundisoli]